MSDGDFFESNGERLIAETVASAAQTFVDIGANRGNWADTFRAACPKLQRGILVDASSEANAILTQRFGSDGRLSIAQVAVSESKGRMTFFEEQDAGGMSSFVKSWASKAVKQTEVEVTTIDALFERYALERADFLKIDVEGYDCHALRGAGAVLAARRVGVVQFEYNDPWRAAGSTLLGALSWLAEHGYSTYLLKGDGLHPVEYERYGEHFSRSNYVGVSPEMHALVGAIVRS
jgi:FkbM family methyltransferase